MDLEIIMLSEVRERQIVYYFYVDSKKKKKGVQMNLSTKQKQSYRSRKQTYG